MACEEEEEEEEEKRGDFFTSFSWSTERRTFHTRRRSDYLDAFRRSDASNRPRFNTQKKREKKQKHPRVKL